MTGNAEWAFGRIARGETVQLIGTDIWFEKCQWKTEGGVLLQNQMCRTAGWDHCSVLPPGTYCLAPAKSEPAGAPEKPKETAMCKSGDARWAWAQIAQFGVMVRRPCDGVVFRAAENCGALYIEFRYPPSTAWTRCSTLSSDTYELVRPEPEPLEAPEGYERWEIVGPEQSCKAFLCAAEPARAPLGGRYWPLYTAQFLPRFGYFVFEKVDDSGVLQRRYSKHLHIVWDKTAGRFTDGDIGDNGYAFRSLDEVEEVRPVAVLMRNG